MNPSYQLIYKIFSETGLRTKEVLFLEEKCIEDARYEGLKQLKYLPYKTLSARKKKGVPSYHKIMITERLADEIMYRYLLLSGHIYRHLSKPVRHNLFAAIRKYTTQVVYA